MTEFSRDTELELAALADGSLAGQRRERALARASGSSELRAALAEQRRAVALMAAVDVRAPALLHRRIESMRMPAPRRRMIAAPRVAFAAALAALALAAVAIGLSEGGSSALSVQRAAALTLSPATLPAPAESSVHRAQLAASVGGVAFPYWEERFGWRGSGARSDQIGGHLVRTVFYTNRDGRRIGYAIASGRAPVTHGGTLVRRWGEPYWLLTYGGVAVVTWRQGGHLCVVSGRDVSARTLLSLASWGAKQPLTS